jgi:thymidine kinase
MDFEAVPVERAAEILEHVKPETSVVAIDEAQFFDDEIVTVAEQLADNGVRVIIAGLDLDFRGEPFGPMPALMCRADQVQKLHAICMVCGEEATRTQRLVNGKPANYDDPIILVGASESYEARCRTHHSVPGKKR